MLERAKRIAAERLAIPRHYVTRVEDIAENGPYTEAILWWENPENEDRRIMVTLAMPEGRLLEYEIFSGEEVAGEDAADPPPPLSLAERLQAAEKFLAVHAPDYQTEFPYTETEVGSNVVRFSWSQEVGGLPLPQTGCLVGVDGRGKVVKFAYRGKADRPPSWPQTVRPPEEVRQHLLQHLEGRLVLVRLNPNLYEIPDDGRGELRLVYALSGCLLPAADTGKDVHHREDFREPDPKRTPLPPPPSSRPVIRGVDSLASFLGLDGERYERTEGETDSGALFITWRRRDKKAPAAKEKTLDALFQQKFSGSVGMTVDPSTGLLVNLVRFEEQEADGATSPGKPLSSQACWEAALSFLYRVFPETDRFLYRIEAEGEIPDSPPVREAGANGPAGTGKNQTFSFEAFVDGVPLHWGRITVVVNRLNGQIVSYMGMDDHPSIFLPIPSRPSISFREALERCAPELKVRLEWFCQYSDNPAGDGADKPDIHHRERGIRYTLVYRPYFSNGEIRFIDAMTGEPIRERRME